LMHSFRSWLPRFALGQLLAARLCVLVMTA
jgi:hypothetical protein